MTNVETYYKDAGKPNGALPAKIGGAFRSLREHVVPSRDDRERMGRKARHAGTKTMLVVRRHPVKTSLAAAGVAVLSVAAFLLINRRTREGGIKLVRQGIGKVRS